MADVVLKDLTKSYGKNSPVVRGVSLAVQGGELISLLGPSGCGKTTILRMIAGLLLPDGGSIRIRGADVTQAPPYRRDIGMVFQNYALFPHRTVAENIGFGLRMRHVEKADLRRRVGEALEMVKLTGFGDRYPKQLSGGQQQRVALARALALRPAVLLLDEPLSALDAQLRHDTREEIRRLQKELGLTAVFVTHDQEEALAISDRIAVLSHGIVQQIDRPENLFERPANEFVARFMGVGNVFAATPAGNKQFRTAGGMVIENDGPTSAAFTAVGIRPEKVRVDADGAAGAAAGAPNSYRGTVAERSYTGTLVRLMLKLEAGETLLAVVPSSSPAADLAPGAPALVSWDPAHTLLLNPEATN